MSMIRTRWAAVGAAVAITLGAGGVSLTQAAIGTGDKPVFVSLDAPCRVIDTRSGSPIGAGDAAALTVQITGANGACIGALAIPADAVGVATNVTVIQPNGAPSGRSYFTVYPADATRPVTSNLNFVNGQAPTPNKVDVGLSADGKIKIFNFEGTAHAAVDIFGYYVDHHHDDRYYTEGETDGKLGTKANTTDVYTRTEVDALIAASPAPWQVIPSGTTVSGPVRWDEESPAASGDYRFYIPFPAVAPAEPLDANWAPDGDAATTDDDPQCTGTTTNPTAPPGKVCLYLVNTNRTAALTGRVDDDYLRRGFEIWWNATASGDMFVYGAWAYTAP